MELFSPSLGEVLTQELCGLLSALRVLELDYNHLSGPIQWSLSRFPKLQRLSLAGNHLGGVTSAILGRFEALEGIDLGGSELRGIIQPALGQLQALKMLDLGFNRLRVVVAKSDLERAAGIPRTVPEKLTQLKELRVLDLTHNYLYGKTRQTWASCKH